MLWGAQQIDAFPGKKVEGVFGMWYGKGPGVDRSGDALRCANMLGTSALGGVLAVAGDDHGAQSSTYPHQTEQVFEGWMMPVLNPAYVQDIIDFGLAGIALSRFSGLWTALKTTAETAEQAATGRRAVASGISSGRTWRPLPPPAWDTTLRSLSRPTASNWSAGWMMERLPAAHGLGAGQPARPAGVRRAPTRRSGL